MTSLTDLPFVKDGSEDERGVVVLHRILDRGKVRMVARAV